MKHTMIFTLFSALLLNACGVAGPNSENPIRLATYKVPQGYQDSVVSILNNNFNRMRNKDEGLLASAEILPNGTVALVGPESVHAGFADLVAELKNSKVLVPENGTVECWVVVAREGTGQQVGTGLETISDALKEIGTQGNYDFMLLEKLRTASVMGERARTEGPRFKMKARLNRIGDHFSVETDISSSMIYSELNTRLYLEPSRFVVIAESRGNTDHPEVNLPEKWRAKSMTLFYIIRVQSL